MLLQVKDLTIAYQTQRTLLRAVEGVSFGIEEGHCMGLIGESGCGKTTGVKGILRLLERNGRILGGKVVFRDRDLLGMNSEDFRGILWEEISFVPQSSMNSLNPVRRVKDQILEAVRAHRKLNRFSKRQYLEKMAHLFEEVGLDPIHMRSYPHQLSGGMAQRAALAMALVLDPALLIADEPTSALDVITQEKIVAVFRGLRKDRGRSLLLISHDLSVVLQVCDRVTVMYAGQVVESGEKSDILETPLHPYTMGLMAAMPKRSPGGRDVLLSIPGSPPDLSRPPSGCRFAERCPFRDSRCKSVPGPANLPGRSDHIAACHHMESASRMREMAKDPDTWKRQKS